MTKKAVILFNLGGPDKLESVEPFLFNLFNDPAIISIPTIFRYPLAKFISKRRAPIAKNIYKEIGNKSPILELTQEQAEKLEKNLLEKGNYKCFVVMRCWHPRAIDVIQKVKSFQPDALLISLGVDTYEKDPISFFKLKSDDFFDIGKKIASCGLPTLFVMEGGYAIKEIGVNTVNVLKGFEGFSA